MTVLEQDTFEAIKELNRKFPKMELRDLFAMNIINGLVANKGLWKDDIIATRSYKLADAMIKARKTVNPKNISNE